MRLSPDVNMHINNPNLFILTVRRQDHIVPGKVPVSENSFNS